MQDEKLLDSETAPKGTLHRRQCLIVRTDPFSMKEKAQYCFCRVKENVSAPIYLVLDKFCRRGSKCEVYRGITILDAFSQDEHSDSLFIRRTKDALKCLAELDERRFRRVQEEIHVIIRSDNKRNSGAYQPSIKCCTINYENLFCGNRSELATNLYICILVFHATQGVLMSKGIRRLNRYKCRADRLGSLEEYRVACKFKDGCSDGWKRALLSQFDKGFIDTTYLGKGEKGQSSQSSIATD